MKIGIDASRLDPGSMAGTQYYLYNLINQLALNDRKNEYIVYTKTPISKEFFGGMTAGNPGFVNKALSSKLSFTQVALAHATYADNLHALICPWQTMPVFHKKGVFILSIVHDLAFPLLRFGPTLYTCIFSDHIVAVSEYTKSELVHRFLIEGNKISVCHEGIDRTTYSRSTEEEVSRVRKKYSLTKDYILFVGTHVKRKNLPRLIRAFSSVLKNRTDKSVDFVIGGSYTAQTASLTSLITKSNVSTSVKVIGRVPDSDLVPLLSGSMFLVYVSLTEGFGLPLLEAMSCGVPVLSGNIGALPEVGGDAAYYVNPKSEYAIYNGMLDLLDNPTLRSDLIKLGYSNLDRFSWERHGLHIISLLNNYAH